MMSESDNKEHCHRKEIWYYTTNTVNFLIQN